MDIAAWNFWSVSLRMLAAVRSATVVGIDAFPITVEVDASKGLPSWAMVGLPAGAVRESRERVCAALVNSGFVVPPRKIRVNLAPADTRKEGTGLDLPIAMGVLVATGQLPASAMEGRIFIGELGLDGTIRPVRGVLSVARYATDISCTMFVPAENAQEALIVDGAQVVSPPSLLEAVKQLRNGRIELEERRSYFGRVINRVGGVNGRIRVFGDKSLMDDKAARNSEIAGDSSLSEPGLDFREVMGQDTAKRALEIAAAGGHNVLMVGPPGAGKTLLARRLPSILPTLTSDELLDVLAIHSVAGTINDSLRCGIRPFRSPHHTLSSAGLIGGGSSPRPGEVSLAHNGILFLDEMLEFPRYLLDVLRQPMEDGEVIISRASGAVKFPSRFSLVGATNPCPCGYSGSEMRECVCSPADLFKYQSRLSGPLLDRIDIKIDVKVLDIAAYSSGQNELKGRNGDSSASILERVLSARGMQFRRGQRSSNAALSGRWIDTNARISEEARQLLVNASNRLSMSVRSYHKSLKVARTIADLAGEADVSPLHMAESLRYRVGTKSG